MFDVTRISYSPGDILIFAVDMDTYDVGECAQVHEAIKKQAPDVKVVFVPDDFIAIRSALLEGKMPSEVFPIYADRIARKGFDYIWRGESWKEILPEAIEYVKSEEYLKKVKAHAAKSAIPSEKKEMWEDIRNKKQKGLKRLDVYEEYRDKYSLSGFNKVWYRL